MDDFASSASTDLVPGCGPARHGTVRRGKGRAGASRLLRLQSETHSWRLIHQGRHTKDSLPWSPAWESRTHIPRVDCDPPRWSGVLSQMIPLQTIAHCDVPCQGFTAKSARQPILAGDRQRCARGPTPPRRDLNELLKLKEVAALHRSDDPLVRAPQRAASQLCALRAATIARQRMTTCRLIQERADASGSRSDGGDADLMSSSRCGMKKAHIRWEMSDVLRYALEARWFPNASRCVRLEPTLHWTRTYQRSGKRPKMASDHQQSGRFGALAPTRPAAHGCGGHQSAFVARRRMQWPLRRTATALRKPLRLRVLVLIGTSP